MSALDRRLTALEEIARQVRRREARETIMAMPEAHDLTPAEVEAAVDEVLHILDLTASWRRDGLGEREILERGIAEFGLDPQAVDAEYRAIVSG